jgi:predicted peptidase
MGRTSLIKWLGCFEPRCSLLIGTLICALNPAAGASLTNVQSGTFIIPPLRGQAATNQQQLLERLRHWPKKVEWELRTFLAAPRGEQSMRYLLFKPKESTAETNYPLVLSLHGGGPRHKFEHLLEPYAPGFAYGLGRLVSDDTQTNHPCFVVAPWSNERGWDDENLRLVLGIIASLQKQFRIDTNRIYVTGQSMGGWGTWSLITKRPDLFAAAVPICGGGEPADAPYAKDIPIWAFHGSADGVVPVGYTRNMIAALQRMKAQPTYWEYKDGTHADTAERAYCEPELIEWMFVQQKR